MRHKKELVKVGAHECTILTEPEDNSLTEHDRSLTESEGFSDVLLIQPTDSHDREELDTEVEYIEAHSKRRFMLVALHVNKWFDELSPWQAPPVFGKTPFGDGASETLCYITDVLIPYISDNYKDVFANCDKKGGFPKGSFNGNLSDSENSAVRETKSFPYVVLGGYSLAGLFALWSGSQCAFGGIVAASPSVWFTGWTDYAREHPSLASRVYLSLGDRETHTKTKIMSTVGDRLEEERAILQFQGIPVTLEMNPGNHFQDNGVRMGKGFSDDKK